MPVKSHIINSKFIIEKFRISETDGQVYTLNLVDLKLSRKGPAELGTEYGYYSDSTEKNLSDKYEGPMSQLFKRVIDNNEYDFVQTDCNLIGDFLVALYARNPDILPKTYSKSIAKPLSIIINHSDILEMCERTNLRNLFFDNHYPMILINNTTVDFISSVYGCSVTYNIKSNKTNWFFPLTPKLAIQFINNDDWESLYNKCTHGEINEDQVETVKYFNTQIADALDLMLSKAIDKTHDIYYLFSNSNVELKRLKIKFKSERKQEKEGLQK